jgi:KUP system potassium uptake protein
MLQEIPDSLAAADGSETEAAQGGGRFIILALGSIGVVFGDIGTSPLYALQTALGQFKDKGLHALEVVGVVSLIVWALLIVVTAKYVLFLMQADNKGEGGILSLNALARTALGGGSAAVFLLGVAGAALFSGDAIITPAISVLSALEGLKQVNEGLTPFILPATLVILIVLFFVQSRGTAGVAAFFGPIMLVFFIINTVLGVMEIPQAPGVLAALSPLPGIKFLWAHGGMGFVVLGSVFSSSSCRRWWRITSAKAR